MEDMYQYKKKIISYREERIFSCGYLGAIGLIGVWILFQLYLIIFYFNNEEYI